MSVVLEIVDDPARGCAALMVGAALGHGHIVLTGGSTPRSAYEHFVEAVQTVGIDLRPTTFWMGDERCVDPADDRSNFKMIKESLLDPLGPDNQPTIHRMKGELGPEAGAEDYERTLREAGPPVFDLLLLGIGPDGHCASLFPHQETLSERSRMAIGVPHAGLEPYVPRISLTLPMLTGARHITFLASGDSKADAIGAAFGPAATPDPGTPSSLLAPQAKLITVLVDQAAAARLDSGARG
ncbi:MAG TPA: 6-phosphogluconolactonase [Solirubrobacteraceae bacterium]|nr:6-phosphogluconolactonase [Solirubrobacteraceae bacterium]